MKFFVYILYSPGHDKYYVGQTDSVSRRIPQHNSGRVKSTAPYRPWETKLILEKKSRAESLQLEKKLKNLKKKRLEEFIKKYSAE
jgi:putative endonuclease